MDKELSIKIRALIQGAKDVAALANDVTRLGNEGRKPITDPTVNLRNGASQTRGIVADLGREMASLVTAGAILKFAKDSVQAFAQAESAFRGLESVANASGFGIANALQQAEKLAADGLITVAEAAKALQNLLARGYSLDQAVTTLERLKDSAAFNRQAHLQLGEAVVTATEGLKNENSILVDNAGVTKNVVKMWEDYAAQLGVGVHSLTLSQRIEAEYQGIMIETQAQLGNSQKALQSYQGQIAQSNQASKQFSQSLGELLAPAMIGLSQIGVFLINNLFKPMVLLLQGTAIGAGVVASALGRLFDAVKTGDFSGISDAIKADMQAAKEVLQDSGKQLYESELNIKKSLKGGEDAQKIADNALKRSATNGQEQRKLTQERIKDYEKLRDAIRKAWDDSIEAERNYLKEAKQLRAEANAFDPKSLAGASPQTVATKEISLRGDLRINEDRLRRKVSEGAPIEDIREQAQVVQDLAEQYRSLTEAVEEDTDKAAIAQRADEAVKASKLGLADALEKAAADERLRQRDQQQLLVDLGKTLAELEKPRTVNVVADQAKTAIDEVKAAMDQVQDKTVTITVRKIDAANAANFTGTYDSAGNALYRDPNTGGASGNFAFGGELPGSAPHDRADNVRYWGTPGEWVIQRPAVRFWGSDVIRAINEMRLPRFAFGGEIGGRSAVSRMSVPRLPSASAGDGSKAIINLTLPGVGTYPVQARLDVAEELKRAIMHEALARGSRR